MRTGGAAVSVAAQVIGAQGVDRNQKDVRRGWREETRGGRDDRGRRLSAGVYLVRALTTDGAASAKVVRVTRSLVTSRAIPSATTAVLTVRRALSASGKGAAAAAMTSSAS